MVKLFSLLAIFGAINANNFVDFSNYYETLFVFETIRHGARSHYMETPHLESEYFGKGVLEGYITDIGRAQHLRFGHSRRNEYVKGKNFLSEQYNPDEILSLSTFKQRCAVSGIFYLHGLYPL